MTYISEFEKGIGDWSDAGRARGRIDYCTCIGESKARGRVRRAGAFYNGSLLQQHSCYKCFQTPRQMHYNTPDPPHPLIAIRRRPVPARALEPRHRDIQLREVMPPIRLARRPPVQALLADVPVSPVTDGAVVKVAPDELVAAVARVLGVHLDHAVPPLAVADGTLRDAVAAQVVVAAVTLGAVGVGPRDGLVADVAVEVHHHGGVLGEVGEVGGSRAMALLLLALV